MSSLARRVFSASEVVLFYLDPLFVPQFLQASISDFGGTLVFSHRNIALALQTISLRAFSCLAFSFASVVFLVGRWQPQR